MDKLKRCPFCGGEAEFDNYGTCISLLCKECTIGFDWQVCDVLENWADFDFIDIPECCSYEPKAVDLVKAELTKAWNTRSKSDEI